MKIRIKFEKQGLLRFVGHLDLMRYFQKAIRRADIPIRYSEGFSPHQIMSFAAPLGMGIEGTGEYMDIETRDEEQQMLSSHSCIDRLNAQMAEGMRILKYLQIPQETENAMASVHSADYRILFPDPLSENDFSMLKADLKNLLEQSVLISGKKTKNGDKEINIRPLIFELNVRENGLFMNIAQGSEANLKPGMLTDVLRKQGTHSSVIFASPFRIVRTEIYDKMHKELDTYGRELL